MSGKGLGKGFDSLFPEAIDMAVFAKQTGEAVQELALSDIVPNPDQPRRHFDQAALEELSQSIKVHGVIQPLIVTKTKQGNYEIIAGERRWRASQLAGLTKVPVVIRSVDDQQKVELALIENVQREDLNAIEQAVSIVRLRQEFGMNYEDVAKRLGKAYTTVINLTRLLQLPKAATAALQTGKISEGHARAILALREYPAEQSVLLKAILQHDWTVRQAEQYAVQIKRAQPADPATTKPKDTVSPEDKQRLDNLVQKLQTNVRIERRAKGGRLVIEFKNDDQLEQLTSYLNK
jgi:ParB family chromosome partitioning protein